MGPRASSSFTEPEFLLAFIDIHDFEHDEAHPGTDDAAEGGKLTGTVGQEEDPRRARACSPMTQRSSNPMNARGFCRHEVACRGRMDRPYLAPPTPRLVMFSVPAHYTAHARVI